MTLREALTAASSRLAASEEMRLNASRDAELLLLHTLNAPRTLVFTDPGYVLREEEQAAYDAAVSRRVLGEPIQYIIGVQEFYGLALKVTPAVLIPRPETELLVEAVLARLPTDKTIRICDVGTGSGAIAIALANHVSHAQVVAVDLSQAALEVARENAVRHHLEDRIQFLQSDLLEALRDEEVFDAIVSNPPYIPDGDRASLHRQVREYEPAGALFAGTEGLDVYRRLIPQAWETLKPGGLLALEIGYGQSENLETLLGDWHDVLALDDLQGIARVVVAWKSMK